MPIQRYEVEFEILLSETLEIWRRIPPAVASDCMNRGQSMAAAIKPVRAGTKLVGQARTVTAMVGDNGPSHIAIGLLRPGDVLVIDARGYDDAAVWGFNMTRAAMARQAAGVVIDGAVRDVAEIRELGFPCFARAAIPGGPHKGFGGTVDGPISCAGCPVRPGDLVLGDDDGVVVVPLVREEAVRAASLTKLEQEAAMLAAIEEGRTTAEIIGIEAPVTLES